MEMVSLMEVRLGCVEAKEATTVAASVAANHRARVTVMVMATAMEMATTIPPLSPAQEPWPASLSWASSLMASSEVGWAMAALVAEALVMAASAAANNCNTATWLLRCRLIRPLSSSQAQPRSSTACRLRPSRHSHSEGMHQCRGYDTHRQKCTRTDVVEVLVAMEEGASPEAPVVWVVKVGKVAVVVNRVGLGGVACWEALAVTVVTAVPVAEPVETAAAPSRKSASKRPGNVQSPSHCHIWPRERNSTVPHPDPSLLHSHIDVRRPHLR